VNAQRATIESVIRRVFTQRHIALMLGCEGDYQGLSERNWEYGGKTRLLAGKDGPLPVDKLKQVVHGFCRHRGVPEIDVSYGTDEEYEKAITNHHASDVVAEYCPVNSVIRIMHDEAEASTAIHEFTHYWLCNTLFFQHSDKEDEFLSFTTNHGAIFTAAYAENLALYFKLPVLEVIESMKAVPLHVSHVQTEWLLKRFRDVDFSTEDAWEGTWRFLKAVVEWDHGLYTPNKEIPELWG